MCFVSGKYHSDNELCTVSGKVRMTVLTRIWSISVTPFFVFTICQQFTKHKSTKAEFLPKSPSELTSTQLRHPRVEHRCGPLNTKIMSLPQPTSHRKPFKVALEAARYKVSQNQTTVHQSVLRIRSPGWGGGG